ncbi:membrane protein [Deinococcus roseus]|uniref:Membrane protein n=2 Tax=Deinococcus roseus TaxID=392414 RepID=A0ABQ2CWY5_9DEIO|nr:membrane protein [Deinococcus roseus]
MGSHSQNTAQSSPPDSISSRAKAHVRDKVQKAAPWLEKFARFGYFCKGIMYLTIAFLAIRGVLQEGRNPTDQRGALEYLGRNTFSDVMLVVLAIGLLGYSLWQFLRAFLDPEGQGKKLKGIFKRMGYAFSGAAYLTLSWAAVRVSLLKDHVWDQNSEEHWTARILELPAGREMVGLLGLVFLALALNQIYVAVKGSFMKHMESWHLNRHQQTAMVVVGRIGILARGLVVGMVGWLFLKAAWYIDAEKAGGMSEAIRSFERAPGGVIAYSLIALGMLLYGLYAWIQAAYRRIPLQDSSQQA